jgi:hypothetical protein
MKKAPRILFMRPFFRLSNSLNSVWLPALAGANQVPDAEGVVNFGNGRPVFISFAAWLREGGFGAAVWFVPFFGSKLAQGMRRIFDDVVFVGCMSFEKFRNIFSKKE